MKLSLFALAALLLVPSPVRAGQATCSNPGLPVGATASSDLVPDRITFGLTLGLLPITDSELVLAPQGVLRYDSSLSLFEARPSAEVALRSWLAVGMALPYRVADERVTYRNPDTGEITSPQPTQHARDETLQGVGDASVHLHLARELGRFRLHARAGTTIPLGSTVEDPFRLGMQRLAHEHIQLGTGTFIPFAAVEAQRPIGRVTTSVWGLVYASLYGNRHGYRPGHRISAGLSASSQLGLRRWTFGLGFEAHGETAERWHGVVYEDEGNAGRLDLLASTSAAWRITPTVAVTADLKVPVASWVVGNQLDYPVVLGVGLTGTFDLGHRPTWHGTDHEALAADQPLTPVAGKITVFDLWATWCAPCRELAKRLEALARRYPDKLAIRTLDVVDDDSPAWQQYLGPGQFVLPHLKVYGVNGALLFERTAAPAELVKAVEDALRAW